MTKLKALLGFALVWVVIGGLAFAADKAKSDKERIAQLENDVMALKVDLEGAHQWANQVNEDMQLLDQRTLDLHKRLSQVESRGPVASIPEGR